MSPDPHPKLIPGDYLREITVGGVQREYLVHIPEALCLAPLKTASAWPLVLAFHGAGSCAEQMAQFTRLNDTADCERFVVAYPNGTGRLPSARSWNAGFCCGHAHKHQVDDLEFVGQVLSDLEQFLPVDRQRVYATGISNGAMLVYLLADAMSDRLSAVAPVAGTMGTDTCHPSRGVSIIHFHGTGDSFVPFQGGRGPNTPLNTRFHSVDHAIQNWVRANDCHSSPRRIVVPAPSLAIEAIGNTKRPDPPEKTNAQNYQPLGYIREEYGPGRDGAEVVLITIPGCGHTWPGEPATLDYLGTWTDSLSANDLMWEFFQRHSRS